MQECSWMQLVGASAVAEGDLAALEVYLHYWVSMNKVSKDEHLKPKLRLLRWRGWGLGCGFAVWCRFCGVYVGFRVSGMLAPMRSKARRWVGVGSARAGMVTSP